MKHVITMFYYGHEQSAQIYISVSQAAARPSPQIYVLRMLYFALAQFILQYGIISLGRAHENMVSPFKTVQTGLLKIFLVSLTNTRNLESIFFQNMLVPICRTRAAQSCNQDAGIFELTKTLTSGDQRSVAFLAPRIL